MAVFSQGVAILRYRAVCVLQLNQAGHSKACCALFLFSSLLSSPLDYNFQEKSRVYPSFTSPSQKYVRTTLGPAFFFIHTPTHGQTKQNKNPSLSKHTKPVPYSFDQPIPLSGLAHGTPSNVKGESLSPDPLDSHEKKRPHVCVIVSASLICSPSYKCNHFSG